jgi:uncharacterized phage infection (PIP) family protein YhgE
MDRGIGTMDRGIGTMDRGIGTMDRGIGTMDKGIETMDKGIETMDKGIETMDKGIVPMDRGIVPMDWGFVTILPVRQRSRRGFFPPCIASSGTAGVCAHQKTKRLTEERASATDALERSLPGNGVKWVTDE